MGEHDGRLFIAMELLNGQDLAEETGPVACLRESLVPAHRVPTEIPRVRVQDSVPHKIPTDDTALPGTRRHEC